jgi:hypothetical protein
MNATTTDLLKRLVREHGREYAPQYAMAPRAEERGAGVSIKDVRPEPIPSTSS